MKEPITHNVLSVVAKQKKYYNADMTLEVGYRIKQLLRLKESLIKHKEEIVKAIEQDFGVSGAYEAYGRLVFILDEIKNFVKHLNKWLQPVSVGTPVMLQPGKSKYIYEPLGVILIIGAWNAPFNVTFLPLIAAIAAGNCCVVKPSELSPASSRVITQIINSAFSEEYCKSIEGDKDTVTELLRCRFDMICYTGGAKIGKIIYQAAAEQLIPVILELGGKSPCVVDETANIKVSAKRICQAKHMIAGQVCTSPDYLLVHTKIKGEFIKEMQSCFARFYPDGALVSPDYSRIINEKNFERLLELLKGIPEENILHGGGYDQQKLRIEPTIIDNVEWESTIMQNEIFGPLVPVLEYDNLDSVISNIRRRPKPLALYIYSKNMSNIQKIINKTTSGGVGVNISIQHFLNRNLPFGGVGNSGIGRYRGKFGVYAFSNQKAIYEKKLWIETKLMDPPYADKANNMEMFLR